jgi:hypothetical protein
MFAYNGLTLYVYEQIKRGAGAARLAMTMAAFAVCFEVFEVIAIRANLWHYYGQRPLDDFGHPVWVSVLNAAIPVVAGVLFVWLERVIPHGRRWLGIVVLPIVFGAISFGLGAPALVAINLRHPNATLAWTGAILSVAGCAAAVRLALSLLPPPPVPPRRPNRRPNAGVDLTALDLTVRR